jgi:hypothetical protein
MKAELDIAPSFTYEQDFEGDFERPVTVVYWNGSIELKQSGNSILLQTGSVKELFREIERHKPEAFRKLGIKES